VVIVGNCQARPLATILPILNSRIEVIDVAIVHLLKSDQHKDYQPSFESSDLIIAQLVNNTYPCDFVRTSFLKEYYGSKVISIVNLYFTGYTPDWFYMRIPGKGPLKGPMGDYQNRTIFEAWKRGLSAEKAAFLLQDKEYNQQFRSSSENSLLALTEREFGADVIISDFIQENCHLSRLFFTFNHPSMRLIIEYSRRIIKFIDLYAGNSSNISFPEMLNKFSPRVNPSFSLFSQENLHHKGVDYEISEDNSIALRYPREYDSLQISTSFFKVYDVMKEKYNLYDFSGSVDI